MPEQWKVQRHCISTVAMAPLSLSQLCWSLFHHLTHGLFHHIQQHLSYLFQCSFSHLQNHSTHPNHRLDLPVGCAKHSVEPVLYTRQDLALILLSVKPYTPQLHQDSNTSKLSSSNSCNVHEESSAVGWL